MKISFHTFQKPKQRLLRRNRRLNVTPLMIKPTKWRQTLQFQKAPLTENNEAIDIVMEIDVTAISTRPKWLDEPRTIDRDECMIFGHILACILDRKMF